MKYIFFALIALVCLGSSFSGCQKEDLGNLDGIFSDTTQAGPVSQMTARINNVPWEATSYNVTLLPGTSGQVIITGESDNGQTIDLVVNNSKAGDYLLTRFSSHVAWYSPDSTDAILYKSNATLTTGGVINIDSIDTLQQVISGEFNFIGGAGSATTQTITDGVFVNLGYINSNANTEFAAKVNGNVWNPISVTPGVSATNMLTITATDANGQKMLLTFPANIKASKVGYTLASTGNYTAAFIDAGYTLVPDATSNYNLPKLACNLKITSNTTTGSPRNIKGTFSFYAVNGADLTQKGSRIASGVFNVNY